MNLRPDRIRKVSEISQKVASRAKAVAMPAISHPNGFLTIFLPIPPKLLSPNGSHKHWRTKAKAKKGARVLARLVLLEALNGKQLAFQGYSLAFFHAVKRNRDDDNAEAACKAYRDGIAEALGMDDCDLRKCQLSTFAIDGKNPRLEVTLWRTSNIEEGTLNIEGR